MLNFANLRLMLIWMLGFIKSKGRHEVSPVVRREVGSVISMHEFQHALLFVCRF